MELEKVYAGVALFGTGEPKPWVPSTQNLSKAVAIAEEVSASSIKKHVLAIVGTRNRFTAQEKMTQVEDYIHETFSKYGWTVERQPFHYDALPGWKTAGGETLEEHHNLEGANIVATRLGKNTGQTVIVGAHFDTVDNTPGADDNGAAVAVLLELARTLGKHDYEKTLMLVAFDMEEIGLAGSQAFVKKLPSNANVEGAIILETIGYFNEKADSQKIPQGFSLLYRQQVKKVTKNQFRGDFITVIHNGKSRKLAALLAGANQSLKEAVPLVFIRDPLDLPVLGALLKRLVPALRNLLRSDHVPFWQAEIPTIQITDTANFRNPNYHRPTDTTDTLNFTALQRLTQTTAITIMTLAEIRMA